MLIARNGVWLEFVEKDKWSIAVTYRRGSGERLQWDLRGQGKRRKKQHFFRRIKERKNDAAAK
jgi:hypothetical protein